jgi:transposase InsO family protein
VSISPASIYRHLRAAGLIEPQPQKRPKSSYIRFAAEQPNERWQADFTHWWLADCTHVEILNRLDDHARYALSVTAHRRITGPIVLTEFRKACAAHGIPVSTLTDNGMVFTTRLSGGKGGRNQLENELRRLGVIQINSTPNHPTTCGKVERFHQTLKKWLARQPRAATIAELQAQLDVFVAEYNHGRPHRALPNRATRPPPTKHARKQPPANASTPTTGCAPTASTKPAASPCATPDASTTSASAEPTRTPACSSSSKTSTSESSTPPPASYYAS